MADTTINPPSSSLKLYYRVARFAWQNGEQYLGFTSDLYFRLPSSHIYETCENFVCWETEWIALPAHRSAAEAASISILSSGELCSGEVAANERSESATPLSSPLSLLYSTAYGDEDESATGQTSPSEYAASLTEAKLLAECEVAEILDRIEVALDEAGSHRRRFGYIDGRLTYNEYRVGLPFPSTAGVIDNYGSIYPMYNRYNDRAYFTYTHD